MKIKGKPTTRTIACVALLLCFVFCLTSCNISLSTGTGTDSDANKIKALEETINKAVLQYPTKNAEFYYNVYDAHVTITKYIGEGGDVTVPCQIENLPVYVIAAEAFAETDVTSVIIEEGVLVLEKACFKKCAKLESIKIPDSVFKIGENAFQDCTTLLEITTPRLVSSVPKYMCAGCTSLKTVKINSSINGSTIGDYAFRKCENLSDVHVSDTISKISMYAFSNISSDAVFYGSAASPIAVFCANNFFEFVVVGAEETPSETVSTENANETEPEEITEISEEEIEENDNGSGSSIVPLIIIIVLLLGIAGGAVTFFVIKKRREY